MKKIIIFAIMAALIIPTSFTAASPPASCVDVQFLFARGSGAAQGSSAEYFAFENSIKHESSKSKFTYEITDLSYPAVSIDNLGVILSAYVSAGKSGAFADSVSTGVANLTRYYQETSVACPNAHWVLFGYSQGAGVIVDALRSLDAKNIVYAALFGDPHLYLPEGEGLFPPACDGRDLSPYRTHVPNCHTDNGILGARKPYLPSEFIGKVGLWCNDSDLICGSSKNIFINSGHLEYASSGGIPSAAKQAIQKIKYVLPAQTIPIEEPTATSSDVAFIIDSSASMETQIIQYRPEIISMAASIIKNGGRVALLAYGNISKQGYYSTRILCDLDCSLGEFSQSTYAVGSGFGISASSPASMVVAATTALNDLSWRQDNTKSIVAFTNIGYEKPKESLIVTHEGLVQQSQQASTKIFTITANQTYKTQHEILTSETGGKSYIAGNTKDLTADLLKAPSTPRAASQQRARASIATLSSATSSSPAFMPTPAPTNLRITDESDTSVRLSWQNPSVAASSLLIVDDAILGIIPSGLSEIVVTDLDPSKPHDIILRSLDENGQLYGSSTDTIAAKLYKVTSRGEDTLSPKDRASTSSNLPAIGVPNTGAKQKSTKND